MSDHDRHNDLSEGLRSQGRNPRPAYGEKGLPSQGRNPRPKPDTTRLPSGEQAGLPPQGRNPRPGGGKKGG
jgi:hypothetical protein